MSSAQRQPINQDPDAWYLPGACTPSFCAGRANMIAYTSNVNSWEEQQQHEQPSDPAASADGLRLALLWRCSPRRRDALATDAIDDLPNPPELRSDDGVLRGTLTVAPAEITVRGRKVLSQRHQRQLPGADAAGPARRHDPAQGGQRDRQGPGQHRRARSRPTSTITAWTCRRTRRTATTCSSGSSRSRSLRYDVPIPKDHPQGLHWYHAHVHHFRRRPDRLGRLRAC